VSITRQVWTRAALTVNLTTAVERFKIPFALSDLSKGERDFESHPMGERGTAAQASTVLSTNDISAFQRPLLG
jgi:hypothetical protein